MRGFHADGVDALFRTAQAAVDKAALGVLARHTGQCKSEGAEVGAGCWLRWPGSCRRTDQTPQVIIAGHAFMQNLARGHYEIGVDSAGCRRVAEAFTELARAV